MARDDMPAAREALERACRLAPDDDAAALSLALLRLRDGEAGPAVATLEAITARLDVREAWLALAAGRRALHQPGRAAAALGAALSGHLLADDALLAPLADAVVAAAEAPGWCGVARDGRLVLRPAERGARPLVTMDGHAVPPGRRPVVPAAVGRIDVTLDGRPLVGSPLAPSRARRIEGVAFARDGGIEGWAWHPGDPETDPVLRIVPVSGPGELRVRAADQNVAAEDALARPRGFRVAAAALAGFAGPVRVLGRDGGELAGSPLDPGAEARTAAAIARAVARRYPWRGEAPPEEDITQAAAAAALRGPPARARAAPHRRMAVVVPAYRGLQATLDCLAAVFATTPAGTIVIVVDDATPEPALATALDDLARQRRIWLLRHAANQGFPAAANAGMRLAATLPGGPDVVLLNSDTLVTPGWLEGLRAAVHAAPDIGTATPLSNDASIMSYPDPAAPAAAPQGAALARLARLAARTLAGVAVELPTAIGFCMYIRRECLAQAGLFRADLFAQGYGEENDFCLRARHLGWRHVGVPGCYVAHLGGHSFGGAKARLLARNQDIVERLHPGYLRLIQDFRNADPLTGPRRLLDSARWQAARRRGGGAVLLVSHADGGGVERVLRDRCAALRAEGLRPVVLRPVPADGEPRYRPGLCEVGEGVEGGFPNLRFALPGELDALARLLRADRPVALEVHHMLGHDRAVLRLAERLGVPTDFHVHDYAAFCPRITLVGAAGHYCGEPEQAAVCDACVADAGAAIEEDIPVAALRARSAAEFARARRVVAPSQDAAARLRRHFPAISPEIVPLEADSRLPPAELRPSRARRLVCVVGAIGPVKGYDVLLACARDAAWRDLPLEFVLAGHSTDDARLMLTGRIAITGPYREADAEAMVRRLGADLAWLPSIWPETWCYTLGTAWRAGLRVAAFDIGAPAERIRRAGRGWVLPLGLPAGAINNALLAVNLAAGDV
ncbi:MAG: hypothetical protein BGP12_06280 [Rhodospirillales bacterium 70-18]|nr:glycosyltransferase [Rhodospirillales bacterium]OJY77034.1 MAG: hypothetical protein BGP12_06280 [Rhodospirillales bacterium 70-18]